MSSTTSNDAMASVRVIRASPSRARRRRAQWAGLLFVAPCLLMVCVFFLVPLGMTLWMSLHDWPLLGTPTFIGLGNYAAMLHDGGYWHALGFTLEYTVVITILLFGVALPLALFVERPRRGVGLLRTAYFMPAVVGFASASLLWVWLINDDSGLVSPLAQRLGLTHAPLAILSSFGATFAAVCAMVVWKMAGFTMMMLLPGLQSVPVDVLEAARIDGATYLERFRLITLPLIRRTLAMTLVISVTGSLLAFDQFYIVSNGGPENSTLTAVYWIVNTSFVSFRLGYGAALSVVLMAIVVAVNVTQIVLLRDRADA